MELLNYFFRMLSLKYIITSVGDPNSTIVECRIILAYFEI